MSYSNYGQAGPILQNIKGIQIYLNKHIEFKYRTTSSEYFLSPFQDTFTMCVIFNTFHEVNEPNQEQARLVKFCVQGTPDILPVY